MVANSACTVYRVTTMSNHYNGARRVPVVFARNGTARLVVRRDTWDDLLMRDVD
jgi:diaminopimelate decarboxylase